MSKSSSILGAFSLGLIAGAVLVAFNTPYRGSELQKEIDMAYHEAVEKLGNKIEDTETLQAKGFAAILGRIRDFISQVLRNFYQRIDEIVYNDYTDLLEDDHK